MATKAKVKPPTVTEKDFTAAVRDLAKLFGWRWYHPFLSKWSEKGYPDVTLVRERIIFAELKTDTGKLTPSQEEWLAALKDASAETYVWRPRNFDAIVETLRNTHPQEKEASE